MPRRPPTLTDHLMTVAMTAIVGAGANYLASVAITKIHEMRFPNQNFKFGFANPED